MLYHARMFYDLSVGALLRGNCRLASLQLGVCGVAGRLAGDIFALGSAAWVKTIACPHKAPNPT